MIILKVLGKSHIIGWYKQRLRMHSWSHVCLSIDGTSGHVASAIDGQHMRNFTVEELRTAAGINLDKRLVLGVTWSRRLKKEFTNLKVLLATSMHMT